MKKLVERLGTARLSKSQVSEMARPLDVQVAAFRTDPLDALTEKLPAVAAHSMPPPPTSSPSPTRESGLAPDPVQQALRAAEPGDPLRHRCHHRQSLNKIA